jgi:hypothetical protein
MNTLEVMVYTEKSVVLIGDTTDYKDELLNTLGGKWNSNLTNKSTGEKFGGWIFPTTKKNMLEKWIKTKCENPKKKSVEKLTIDQRLTNIEKKLEKFISIVEKMKGKNTELNNECDEIEYEVEEVINHKRLLK